MAGNYVSLAYRVLRTTKERMTARGIWKYASREPENIEFSHARKPWEVLRQLAKEEAQQPNPRIIVHPGRPCYLEYNPAYTRRSGAKRPRKRLTVAEKEKKRETQKLLAKHELPDLLAAIKRKQSKLLPWDRIEVWDYQRDAQIVEAVRKRANYHCEMPGCTWQGFETDNGTLYIEVHHLKGLGEGGEDTVENCAALCPNCHRLLHYSKDREQHLARLIAALKAKEISVSGDKSVSKKAVRRNAGEAIT